MLLVYARKQKIVRIIALTTTHPVFYSLNVNKNRIISDGRGRAVFSSAGFTKPNKNIQASADK